MVSRVSCSTAVPHLMFRLVGVSLTKFLAGHTVFQQVVFFCPIIWKLIFYTGELEDLDATTFKRVMHYWYLSAYEN